MMFRFLGVCVCVLLGVAFHVEAADRDPFTPYVDSSNVTTSATGDKPAGFNATEPVSSASVAQLDKHPVSTYKLIGIIVAPENTLAVVRGLDQAEYFVTEGDRLGKEGGVISAITLDNMMIEVGGDIVTMKVSNKLVVEGQDVKAR